MSTASQQEILHRRGTTFGERHDMVVLEESALGAPARLTDEGAPSTIPLEIRRAARVGIGWVPQRLNDLDESQTVNETIVSSNDDIKSVKRFALDNWYVSFTFALDSLPLFNK